MKMDRASKIYRVSLLTLCVLLMAIGMASAAPKVLVIKDVDVKAETDAFDILKEAFPMDVNVIAWNQLETEDLAAYNALIVGSRLSDKTINGLSAYGTKILQAVRDNGLGFLSLNNYIFFKDGKTPEKWTQVQFRSVLPKHSDDPREPIYQKLYRVFDEHLATAPFNITSPAKTEFADFLGANYRAVPPRTIYANPIPLGKTLETIFSEYLNTAPLPAFGYIGNINHEHWQVILEGEFRGTPQAVMLGAWEGKGRVLLSTLFLDHDVAVAKNDAAKNMYIETLKWITNTN
ncbi:hypothetical protein U14_01480 [Candidatus Moduliflexus flocculans]|uniref:Uncharacterized protein n=1 Tax=Candidatus Moduliflexus flocculans TaxID=1499966 RepID=A0A0S6VS70_9BACT|nr:hypothetical protein U14_01480 [Candidatus Moduliflexus flocculans]